MSESGINIQRVAGLEAALWDEEVRNPFKGLESAYLQKKAYFSLGLVVSGVLFHYFEYYSL